MYRVSIDGVIETRVEVWENFECCENTRQPQASVSTAFSSSPKLLRMFLQLDSDMGNMFAISFRNHGDGKKECKFSLLSQS